MIVRGCFVCLVAGLLTAAGCSPPDADFVLSERTRELHRDAQQAVAAAVQSNFGTPQELVAWLRLPVNYGGESGTVLDPPEDRPDTFAVDFDPPIDELPAGQELVWLSGPLTAARTGEEATDAVRWTVAGYDPETMLLTVEAEGVPPESWPDDWRPAAEDTFVVSPGEQMKHGRALYMEHCMHCHGVSGDGAGPTAPYLNPLPRDYRLGLFKFTSTATGLKATRADLRNTIRQGLPGTYMPSFLLLEDAELDAIVEYIRWLSMRGEFEKKLVDEMYSDYSEQVIEKRRQAGESLEEITQALTEYLQSDFPDVISTAGDDLQDAWTTAEDESSLLKPGEPRIPAMAADNQVASLLEESRERGRLLYYSDKAKCATCHGPQGRGDGSETFAFRDIPNTNPVQKYPQPGLFDDWGNQIEPRDLTRGIYRGGRRPIDLYRRIAVGIKGTPMPAFTILTEQERWDLVNFVLHVPYLDQPLEPPSGTATPTATPVAQSSAQPFRVAAADP